MNIADFIASGGRLTDLRFEPNHKYVKLKGGRVMDAYRRKLEHQNKNLEGTLSGVMRSVEFEKAIAYIHGRIESQLEGFASSLNVPLRELASRLAELLHATSHRTLLGTSDSLPILRDEAATSGAELEPLAVARRPHRKLPQKVKSHKRVPSGMMTSERKIQLEKARLLAKQGRSLNEIADKLNIPRGTIHRWWSDYEMPAVARGAQHPASFAKHPVAKYNEDMRREARQMHQTGADTRQIATKLNAPYPTVYGWIHRQGKK